MCRVLSNLYHGYSTHMNNLLAFTSHINHPTFVNFLMGVAMVTSASINYALNFNKTLQNLTWYPLRFARAMTFAVCYFVRTFWEQKLALSDLKTRLQGLGIIGFVVFIYLFIFLYFLFIIFFFFFILFMFLFYF